MPDLGNLTYGKILTAVCGITERSMPLPRGERAVAVGEMERALANHIQDIVVDLLVEQRRLRADLDEVCDIAHRARLGDDARADALEAIHAWAERKAARSEQP